MGFLGNLFKKVPGGSKLGNLVRGVVKSSPLGNLGLGSGAGIISQEDYDKKNLSDGDFLVKYGVSKTGVYPQIPVIPNPNIKTVEQQMKEAEDARLAALAKTAKVGAIKLFFQKYWKILLIIPAVALGYIIYKKTRPKTSRSKRR